MKIATYSLQYQLLVASHVIIAVAIAHFLVQRQFDKKVALESNGFVEHRMLKNIPPLYYTILPVMPLILMLGSLVLA